MSAVDTGAAVALRGESRLAAAKSFPSSQWQPPVSLLAALLVIVTALPYLFALQYGFVYDDDVQVLQNIAARRAQSPMTYFVTSIWTLRTSAITLSYKYYRPLFHTWLRLNVALFSDRAMWWHLAAIVLHLGATLLVFCLLRRHLRDPWSATVGAVIFGIHPAHIESVVWVSGATDPLMALGLLGSFLLWLKNSKRPTTWRWIASLACYAAALLCKETAIVLPAVVFVYALLGLNAPKATPAAIHRIKAAFRAILPFLAVTIIYGGIRTAILRPFSGDSQRWLPLRQALLTAPSILLFYLRHLFWPVGLRLFYDIPVVAGVSSVRFWGPLAAIAAGAVCIFLWWRRSNNDRIVPAAAAWCILPLLPVLNIALFAPDDFAHDRYLYLPAIGVAILGGAAMDALFERVSNRRAAVTLTTTATLFLAAIAGLTVMQSEQWRDNFSLYKSAARNSNNTLARMNLASQYAMHAQLDVAKQLLEPVVAKRPDFWLADYNLGYVDYRLGDLTSAAQLLDRAIALNPMDSDSRLYRGLVYLREQQADKAEGMVRQAIALNPAGEGYHFTLGIILLPRNPEAAKAEIREELKYYPTNGIVKMKLDALNRVTSSAAATAAPRSTQGK